MHHGQRAHKKEAAQSVDKKMPRKKNEPKTGLKKEGDELGVLRAERHWQSTTTMMR